MGGCVGGFGDGCANVPGNGMEKKVLFLEDIRSLSSFMKLSDDDQRRIYCEARGRLDRSLREPEMCWPVGVFNFVDNTCARLAKETQGNDITGSHVMGCATMAYNGIATLFDSLKKINSEFPEMLVGKSGSPSLRKNVEMGQSSIVMLIGERLACLSLNGKDLEIADSPLVTIVRKQAWSKDKFEAWVNDVANAATYPRYTPETRMELLFRKTSEAGLRKFSDDYDKEECADKLRSALQENAVGLEPQAVQVFAEEISSAYAPPAWKPGDGLRY